MSGTDRLQHAHFDRDNTTYKDDQNKNMTNKNKEKKMTDVPKRPGGLPTTDKVKNGINRESIVKNVPRSGLTNSKPQSKNKNQK